MAVLRSAVAACSDGASTVVEITGDPGLGKSRLLGELEMLARAQGLTVLSDRCSAFERQRLLLLDVLQPAPHRQGQGHPTRHRAHQDVVQLLADATGGRGVLLCLDDLHWAGEATLELLHGLLRRPLGTPLILACSHRPRQSPGRLLASLQHPAPHYRVARLQLAPLDREACATLLGPEHNTEDRNRLCAAGEGNPFYLGLLSELARSGAAGLPETVRAAVIRETAMLSGDELAVLRAACVLGDPFDPLLLSAVADLPDQRALDALDRLAALDLVRTAHPTGPPSDVQRLLQSRHPVLREAVSAHTPPGWTLAANSRADLALRASGADVVERAPHIARSARPGNADAIADLAEAAASVLHTCPATAATWLRSALRLSATDRSREAASPRRGMLQGLAEALAMTGDLAGCRDTVEQALNLVPPDNPDKRVPLIALGSRVERILTPRPTSTALETELARWPHGAPRADPLRLQLALVRTTQGRYEEAVHLLNTLRARTSTASDRKTRTAVAAASALGAAYSGRREPSRTYAAETAAWFESMNDEELATYLDEATQLGWAETLTERHHDALRHTTRAVAVARRTGQTHLAPYLLLCQSYTQQATGDLMGSAAAAKSAEGTAHQLALPNLVAFALTLGAAATTLQTGPASAAGTVAHVLPALDRRGRFWEASAGTLAALLLEQGRLDDCLDLLRALTGADRPVTAHCLRAMWCCTAARAETARGNHATAREWAARAVESANAVDLPGQRGYAALAQASVQADDRDAAAELYLSAADLFASGGLVPVEARARLLLGHSLADTHRLDEAGLAVGRAKQLADACGATHLALLAVNAHRRIGGHRPRSSHHAPDHPALSEQESRIAELVARGRSNRAVAADLFISVKTVEGHLTRIFRKLHVTSRSGLVTAMDNLGAV